MSPLQVLAEGNGGTARDRPKEAGAKRAEPTNRNVIQGRVSGQVSFTFRGASNHWTDKVFRGFKRRIKELTGRSWFVSMDYRLRRRLRMCCWKRWRRARTKVRELLKLGTSLATSISDAWRTSPRDGRFQMSREGLQRPLRF